MNVNRPGRTFNIQNNYSVLNDLKIQKDLKTQDLKELDEEKKLPEGLVQMLGKWEKSEEQEKRHGSRWDLSRIPLKYFISNGNTISGYKQDFEGVIESAFLDWCRVSFGKIRFARCLIENQSDIVVKWADTVVLGRDFESGHNNLKVINNRIEKAEISIVVYPVIDKLSPRVNRTERVRRTALHEIGHALGLQHSTESRDIMFHRGISNSKISDNDANKLLDLYKSDKINEFRV